MRKAIVAFMLIFIMILAACGDQSSANDTASDNENIIVITERFFVNQIVEIILNADQYFGRAIRYEGILRVVANPHTGEDFFFVIRYTEGCCGVEMVGMELLIENGTTISDDAWVEVTGILEEGSDFPVLRVTSLTEKSERGSDFVS